MGNRPTLARCISYIKWGCSIASHVSLPEGKYFQFHYDASSSFQSSFKKKHHQQQQQQQQQQQHHHHHQQGIPTHPTTPANSTGTFWSS